MPKLTGVAPKAKYPFDIAQTRFRHFPDNWQRQVDYLNAALEHWFDDAISDESFLAALHEIKD